MEATGSRSEEAPLETRLPGGAGERLNAGVVAEIPNEGMVPNVDMTSDAEGVRRRNSAWPKAGEKRPWDETGGVDIELERAMVQVMRKHGVMATSSSSSGRNLVSQETQTELTGEMIVPEKRNKISDKLGCGKGVGQGTGSGSSGASAQEPPVSSEMHPDEILELQAIVQAEEEEEIDQLEALQLATGAFLQRGVEPGDSEWEEHFSEDGRPYYYNLKTMVSQWEDPQKVSIATGKMVGSSGYGVSGTGAERNNDPAAGLELEPTASTPSSESTRAFQGSTVLGGEENASIIGDSGLGGVEKVTPITPGSPRDKGSSGTQREMAGEHLDREANGSGLSEGGAAVETVVLDKKVLNDGSFGAASTEVSARNDGSGDKEVLPGNKGRLGDSSTCGDGSAQVVVKESAFLEIKGHFCSGCMHW